MAVLALAGMLLNSTVAMTQDDDDDPPAEAILGQAQVQNFEMPENQFDQWVFQNFPTAVAARSNAGAAARMAAAPRQASATGRPLSPRP